MNSWVSSQPPWGRDPQRLSAAGALHHPDNNPQDQDAANLFKDDHTAYRLLRYCLVMQLAQWRPTPESDFRGDLAQAVAGGLLREYHQPVIERQRGIKGHSICWEEKVSSWRREVVERQYLYCFFRGSQPETYTTKGMESAATQ
ncbi:MAG: hypothetical protein U0X20_22280 [Caldilineaceae bacterium]